MNCCPLGIELLFWDGVFAEGDSYGVWGFAPGSGVAVYGDNSSSTGWAGRVFVRDATDAWLTKLLAADILAERILDPSQWLANPHVQHVGGALCADTPGVGSVHAARTPGTVGDTEAALTPSAALGQHSRAILREAPRVPPSPLSRPQRVSRWLPRRGARYTYPAGIPVAGDRPATALCST